MILTEAQAPANAVFERCGGTCCFRKYQCQSKTAGASITQLCRVTMSFLARDDKFVLASSCRMAEQTEHRAWISDH